MVSEFAGNGQPMAQWVTWMVAAVIMTALRFAHGPFPSSRWVLPRYKCQKYKSETDGTLAPTRLDVDLYLCHGVRAVPVVVPTGLRLGEGVDFLAGSGQR
jgi:hypothetical protein